MTECGLYRSWGGFYERGGAGGAAGQGTIRAGGRCTQFPGKHQSNSTHIMSALEAVLQLAKIAGYWAVRNTPNSSKEFHTPS